MYFYLAINAMFLKMVVKSGVYIVFIAILCSDVHGLFDNEVDLKCRGKTYRNVSLTAYYPDYDDADNKKGYQDMRGKRLRTLQDYLDDRNHYVTLSMDPDLNIPYATPVCIPELNQHFGHKLRIQVRDSSSDLQGTGFQRADICVRSEIDSYDITVNQFVTLVFEKVDEL